MARNPKRWDSEMLANYVCLEDIPLIQSLVISQGYHQDEWMNMGNFLGNNSISWSTKPAAKLTLSLGAGGPLMSDGMMLQLSTCQTFSTDCKDLVSMIQDPGAWPNFSTELKELMKLKSRFTDFPIVFIPHSENVSSDSLAKIAKSFHRNIYYIGCSVPIWFSRSPQT
ncbi:hypothetical protein IGI04_036256 [Brassica rapa subsp. trilocularis]|uniref:RNase H type-1 domain-containing protein n=1 Tax=Brassica rapa subsp. trilocularis TaxID=1813537 RepID=A0ABQ7LHT0_BRACM|nr:hypothetical protein IGI04_036256 [Brassica rapa subsp. trilocularis]